MAHLARRLLIRLWTSLCNLVTEYGLLVLTAYLLYRKFGGFAALVATDRADGLDLNHLLHPVIPIALYRSFVALTLSWACLFKRRAQGWAITLINLAVSVLMVADLICYRGYKSFLTTQMLHIPPALQPSVPLWSLARPVDLFFVLDALLMMVAMLWRRSLTRSVHRHLLVGILALTLPLGYLSYVHNLADIQRRDYPYIPLFNMSWAPHETMAHLTPVGYHLLDLYDYWQDHLAQPPVNPTEIKAWYQEKQENLPANSYQGLFQGKNLILLQVESLEQFVIKRQINGQAITPTLNRLLSNSLYFPNFYEQVSSGTSSDADLLANTSVYPLRAGRTFLQFPNNSYHSLPVLLRGLGYRTLAMHPDNGIRWNWAHALTAIGFDRYLDSTQLRMDETIGIGLSDGSFLRQVAPIIEQQKQPFYTFMVTLTSHGPFDLPVSYRELRLDPTLDDRTLGGYFQSVHYTDQRVGEFLGRLDQSGLLDNTVVVIYGDHTGIHKFYNDDVEQLPIQEDWWQAEQNNWRIPFLIYAKGLEGKEIETVGGQVDILPTIAALMGIDPSQYDQTAMGRNLLNTTKSFAVLADGSVVGDALNEDEKVRAVQGLELADQMIRNNYFAGKK